MFTLADKKKKLVAIMLLFFFGPPGLDRFSHTLVDSQASLRRETGTIIFSPNKNTATATTAAVADLSSATFLDVHGVDGKWLMD
jgi:hypothetical protein